MQLLIDVVPNWLLFILTVGFVLVAAEVGFRIGRAVRRKGDNEKESPASTISGILLGLGSFMLAFSFSIVSDRYDSKKSLVREEANAIRAVWHRSDLLHDLTAREETRKLLNAYVDHRLTVSLQYDPEAANANMDDALQLQQKIWEMAVENGRVDNSDISAAYIDSVVNVVDLHAKRVSIGLQARVPTGIWFVLFAVLSLGMLCLGYFTAIVHSRRSRILPVAAIAFALVIALIAALDHPSSSVIKVSQQPLKNLQDEMRTVRNRALEVE